MRRYLSAAGMLAVASLLAACGGGSPAGSGLVPGAPQALRPASTNAIQNGCFSTGKLAPWVAVGQRSGAGTVSSAQHWSPCTKYSGFMGTNAPPAVNGPHGLQQTVTVPKNGTLTLWHEGSSTDEAKYGYYEIDILNGTKKLGTCPGTGAGYSDTKLGWKKLTCSLAKYGGQKVTLQFYVNDNGYAKAYVNWYIDDVTLQ